MSKKILISTGDYSGKIYATKLIERILNTAGDIEIYTTFKTNLSDKKIYRVTELIDRGVVGIIEVIPSLLYYYLQLQKLKHIIKEKKIDMLILIDFPDFNFQLIKYAKKLKVKIIYYIPPQMWAWRFERINFLKQYVDKTLVTFKFEKEFYEKYGLPCEFVGHPVIEILSSHLHHGEQKMTKEKFPPICFFPGSRISTVKQLLPLYLQLCELIYCQFPNRPFIFGITKHIPDNLLKKYKFTYPFKVERISSAVDLFQNCSLAIIPTGTISLEAALCRVPSIVVNRTTYINYLLIKDKINLAYLSLPNILAKDEIFPEFLQTKIDTEKILKTAEDFLDYPEKFEERWKKWDKVSQKEFDYTNPVEKAVSSILSCL